jgi:hypothetical protein
MPLLESTDTINNKILKLLGNANPRLPRSYRESGVYDKTISSLSKALLEDPPNLELFYKSKLDFLKQAEDFLSYVKEVSAKENLDESFLVKNAIANGPEGSLCIYKLWLNKQAPSKAKTVDESPNTKSRILDWLLGLGPMPCLRDIGREFAENKTIASSYGSTFPSILNYQRYILKKDLDYCPQDTHEVLQTIIEACGSVAIPEEALGSHLVKLNKKDFKKLIAPTQAWILRNRDLSKAILSDDLLKEIKSNPLKFSQTPEAIKAKEERDHKKYIKSSLPAALKAIERGEFSNFRISPFLDSEYAPDYKVQIRKSFQKTKNIDLSQRIEKGVFKNMSPKWEAIDKHLFLYYSKNPSDKIYYLSSLPPNDLRNFLKALSPLEILTLFRYNTLERRNKSSFKHIRDNIEIFYENKVIKEGILKGLVLNPKDNPINRINHLWNENLWEALSPKDCKAFLEKFPDLMALVKPKHLVLDGIKTFLSKYLEQDPSSFLKGIKDIQEIKSLPDETSTWLKQKLFRSTKLSKPLSKRLAKLATDNTWLIPNDNIVSKEIFNYLWLENKTSLVLLKSQKGEFHFKDYISSNRTKGEEIRNLVKFYNPQEYENFLNIYAQKLWSDKEFNGLLKRYLESNYKFHNLKIHHDVLKALIPYVYKEYKDKPLIASAYTLAMAYSPWNIKFIVGVAIKMLKSKANILDNLYTIKNIPKRKGGLRTLHIPCDELKQIQRNLLDYGFSKIKLSEAVQGFAKATSIITNANPHCKKDLVVNIDIDSFFNSCDFKKILNSCNKLVNKTYCPYGASLLAELCSFKGILPTGSPTSPVLGNLILAKADKAISKACLKYNVSYTRYADDLTFSGSENTLSILPFVKKVLEDLGFRIKEGKTNVYRRGRRQLVTGLVVNEKPHVPRAIRKKIRAAVHSFTNNGHAHWKGKALNFNQLQGRVAFLKQVQK